MSELWYVLNHWVAIARNRKREREQDKSKTHQR